MTFRIFRMVLSLILVFTTALASAATPALADPIDPATLATAALTSNRVAVLQDADGGWVPVVGDADCSAGCLYGEVAYWLLAAYNHKRYAALKPGAIVTLKTANALVAEYDAGPGCDPDRPASDAALLLSIGSLSADPKYGRVGKALLDCLHSIFPTGPSRADALIARGTQAVTDAAFDFVAGYNTPRILVQRYALAEAQRIIARRADWNDPGCPECVLRVKGLLLYMYTPRSGAFTAAERKIMQEWMSDLLRAQDLTPGPNYGSWFGNTATTAYAMMALFVPGGPVLEGLGKLGVSFLHSIQRPDGSLPASLGDATERILTDALAVGGMASEH